MKKIYSHKIKQADDMMEWGLQKEWGRGNPMAEQEAKVKRQEEEKNRQQEQHSVRINDQTRRKEEKMEERGPIKGSDVKIRYDVYVDEFVGTQDTNITGKLVYREGEGSEVEEGVVKAWGKYFAFYTNSSWASYKNGVYTIWAEQVAEGKSPNEAIQKLQSHIQRQQMKMELKR